MQSKTLCLNVTVAKGKVFDYLSDIRNLPRWATEFCQELKVVDGRHKVVTCPAMGGHELFFKVRADRATGVIDMLAGPTEEQMSLFPARVVELSDKSSAVLFTMFQSFETADEQFEQQCDSLRKEFVALERELITIGKEETPAGHGPSCHTACGCGGKGDINTVNDGALSEPSQTWCQR